MSIYSIQSWVTWIFQTNQARVEENLRRSEPGIGHDSTWQDDDLQALNMNQDGWKMNFYKMDPYQLYKPGLNHSTTDRGPLCSSSQTFSALFQFFLVLEEGAGPEQNPSAKSMPGIRLWTWTCCAQQFPHLWDNDSPW